MLNIDEFQVVMYFYLTLYLFYFYTRKPFFIVEKGDFRYANDNNMLSSFCKVIVWKLTYFRVSPTVHSFCIICMFLFAQPFCEKNGHYLPWYIMG